MKLILVCWGCNGTKQADVSNTGYYCDHFAIVNDYSNLKRMGDKYWYSIYARYFSDLNKIISI